jgi:hypothetical protein
MIIGRTSILWTGVCSLADRTRAKPAAPTSGRRGKDTAQNSKRTCSRKEELLAHSVMMERKTIVASNANPSATISLQMHLSGAAQANQSRDWAVYSPKANSVPSSMMRVVRNRRKASVSHAEGACEKGLGSAPIVVLPGEVKKAQ